ncbi:DUF917 family protein [Pseudomonadota bacterium]
MILKKEEIKTLIKGTSLFTTGGGLPFQYQIEQLNKFNDDIEVILKDPKDFLKDSYLMTVSGLGPASGQDIDKKNVIKKMLEYFQLITNRTVSGLYAVELGQETITAEASYLLNLPIADFDCSGGRAVPCVDITSFNVTNINYHYSPLVVCTDREEIIILEGNKGLERTEDIMRQLSRLSDSGVIFMMGECVKVDDILGTDVINNSYSKCLEYGKINSIDEFIKKENPKKYWKNIEVLECVEKEKSGFSFKKVRFITSNKEIYNMIILNEVLFILDKDNKMVYSIPDKILLVNSEKMIGVQSSQIKKGDHFSIIITEPDLAWRGESGKKVFGVNRFKELL